MERDPMERCAPGAGGVVRRAESGNALVVALLILLVMTTAGVAYVAVTKSEKEIAGNQMTAAQALYVAESGITEGLRRMASKADSTNYMGPANSYAGWGRYIVIANGASALDPDGPLQEHDGLDNNGNGIVDEPGERYPEVLTKQTISASTLRYPWVRVEFKTKNGQLVRFGDDDGNPLTPPRENFTIGSPVLKLTAAGSRGTAAKTLEAEAVRFPLVSAGAPIWAGGALTFNGNAFLVDGHDHYMTAPFDTVPGAPAMPGLLTEGPTTTASISGTQIDNVTGTGSDPSIMQSTFTYNFNTLWSTISAASDYSFTGDQTWGSSTPAYGTQANPKITVVNGNLSLGGGWSGSGILMVNGNLSMGGSSNYTGIVIATGNVYIAGGGPGDLARIVGGVIYQSNLINNSTNGGSGKIYFSSQAVNLVQSMSRYTLASWRER
jgi:hypothetical protein